MTNIAMENEWPIEIDGLQIKKMIFHGYVSHNQMVDMGENGEMIIIPCFAWTDREVTRTWSSNIIIPCAIFRAGSRVQIE